MSCGDHVQAIPEAAGATLGRASRPRKHRTMLYFFHGARLLCTVYRSRDIDV